MYKCNDCGKELKENEGKLCKWCDNVLICDSCAESHEGCCDSCYYNGYL